MDEVQGEHFRDREGGHRVDHLGHEVAVRANCGPAGRERIGDEEPGHEAGNEPQDVGDVAHRHVSAQPDRDREPVGDHEDHRLHERPRDAQRRAAVALGQRDLRHGVGPSDVLHVDSNQAQEVVKCGVQHPCCSLVLRLGRRRHERPVCQYPRHCPALRFRCETKVPFGDGRTGMPRKVRGLWAILTPGKPPADNAGGTRASDPREARCSP